MPKRLGHINSYHLYPKSSNFLTQAPLSTTSVFFFKLRSHTCPTSIKVNSAHSKKIVLRLNKEPLEEEVDSTSIKSYTELVKVQN